MIVARPPYADECTQETIKHVTDQGLRSSQVAHDLGLDLQTLRLWLYATAMPNTSNEPTTVDLARLRCETSHLP